MAGVKKREVVEALGSLKAVRRQHSLPDVQASLERRRRLPVPSQAPENRNRIGNRIGIRISNRNRNKITKT